MTLSQHYPCQLHVFGIGFCDGAIPLTCASFAREPHDLAGTDSVALATDTLVLNSAASEPYR
jgi:hypothetical protein